ncbi:hypothetical protein ACWM35_08950 [Neobacillus sp. K501]
MKKELIMAATAFFLMSVTITGVYAMEERANTVTISKAETDITGDGIMETISLKGVPYDEDEHYLKEIYIEVNASNDNRVTIPLESGTKAALKIADLNQDGVKDIFANVLLEDGGENTLNYLYSLKDFIHQELTVPDPLEISSGFDNGYKAKLTINQTGKTYEFDLKDRKKYYKKLGLYYKGKINEPTELTVNSFHSLKPVLLDNGETGLRGIQKITGITNADTIAFVESSWSYKDGKWSLVNTKVRTEKEKKKR